LVATVAPHGPLGYTTSSPCWCRVWAGRALTDTVIRTNGFFSEPVAWQIVTFPSGPPPDAWPERPPPRGRDAGFGAACPLRPFELPPRLLDCRDFDRPASRGGGEGVPRDRPRALPRERDFAGLPL
jgi:hypothetical protein